MEHVSCIEVLLNTVYLIFSLILNHVGTKKFGSKFCGSKWLSVFAWIPEDKITWLAFARWSNGVVGEVVIRSYQIYEADDDVMGLYVKNAVPYSVNMIMSIGVKKRYC